MKTKRGIYTDITKSEYTFQAIDFPLLKFYFSSEVYRNKFAGVYDEEIERFNAAANRIYKNKFDIRMDLLALIRLYVLIEKRGFYLLLNGVEIHCLEDLRFVVMPSYNPNSGGSTS